MNYSFTSNPAIILRSDGANIPTDPGNTDYQGYLAWVAAGNTAGPAPTQTLAQQAQALLAGGLQITSMSTPALNGTYPCDPGTILNIMAEVDALLASGGATFVDGTATVSFPDTAVPPVKHTFTVTQFNNWRQVIALFVEGCDQVEQGFTTTLPSNQATIP